jgi:hypothetical protein
MFYNYNFLLNALFLEKIYFHEINHRNPVSYRTIIFILYN